MWEKKLSRRVKIFVSLPRSIINPFPLYMPKGSCSMMFSAVTLFISFLKIYHGHVMLWRYFSFFQKHATKMCTTQVQLQRNSLFSLFLLVDNVVPLETSRGDKNLTITFCGQSMEICSSFLFFFVLCSISGYFISLQAQLKKS